MIVLYLLAVALANVITAATEPLELGPWLVPWGTFAVAATFVLRDFVQLRHGRTAAYAAIGAGLVLAVIGSALLGDTLLVVAASALAFGVSETLDTEVFTRLRRSLPGRVLLSGVLGGALDTAIFVTVGLVASGIIPWSAAVNAMVGVYLVKVAMQMLGALVVWRAEVVQTA